MSYYTSQIQRKFNAARQYSAIIPDSGSSIGIEFWNGNEWVADEKSPITTPNKIMTQNSMIRFTPSSGGFHIDEGAAI